VSGFPYNKVVTKTLYLLVLDYDRFSRDDPIGEVCLPLSELDLGAGLTLWKTLMPCKGAAVGITGFNTAVIFEFSLLVTDTCHTDNDNSVIEWNFNSSDMELVLTCLDQT